MSVPRQEDAWENPSNPASHTTGELKSWEAKGQQEEGDSGQQEKGDSGQQHHGEGAGQGEGEGGRRAEEMKRQGQVENRKAPAEDPRGKSVDA